MHGARTSYRVNRLKGRDAQGLIFFFLLHCATNIQFRASLGAESGPVLGQCLTQTPNLTLFAVATSRE